MTLNQIKNVFKFRQQIVKSKNFTVLCQQMKSRVNRIHSDNHPEQEKTQINKIKVSRTNFIMFHYYKFAKALLVILAYSTTIIMNNNGLLSYTVKVNAHKYIQVVPESCETVC